MQQNGRKDHVYTIKKITSNPVVDFAAEELKKYLRMMMPRCGEITIAYEPDAKEGFRLGLMEDFGLDVSEAEDLFLDDILHIDTTAEGGIIAGSNPRSVLLAVEQIARDFEEKLSAYRNMPYRVQTVAVRLLAEHTRFCRGLAAAMALKCVGKDTAAKDAFFSFMDQFGARELGMERYYDHFEAVAALKVIFNVISEYDQ